jgi:hypothetical protein
MAEHTMLGAFVRSVSDNTKRRLRDPKHPFPFANLEWPRGTRKDHGITGATKPTQPSQHPVTKPTKAHTRPTRGSDGASSAGRVIDVERINGFLQAELRRRDRDQVPAVQAARWLDGAGLLRDSEHRPGLPLRNLLRAGQIQGQRQEPNTRWFIDGVKDGKKAGGQAAPPYTAPGSR